MPVSFADYLAGCLNRHPAVIDHSLRADLLLNGKIRFYIHPSNTGGDTPMFTVEGNLLTPYDPIESEKMPEERGAWTSPE